MKKPVAPASPLAPALEAVPFLKNGTDARTILLTQRQREDLARIGMRLRLPPRMTIYLEDSPAQWVFAVAEGAVKSFRELQNGKRVVSAFLFSQDLFGLSENGKYLNSAQAITGVTLYRLPIDELVVLFKHDSALQFHFLAKVTHELRESQRRAVLINRKDAAGRLAMFLMSMRQRQQGADTCCSELPLPMNRSDIAAFLGLSLESVSRAAARLERRGILSFEGRHLARILDERKFAKLAEA